MGFFEARRAKKAVKQYQAELATWQLTRNACAANLELSKTYAGDDQSTGIILKPGEALFSSITGVALVGTAAALVSGRAVQAAFRSQLGVLVVARSATTSAGQEATTCKVRRSRQPSIGHRLRD